MSKHYDGGPVHPTLPDHGFNQGEPGMTLRDYFAAKAMQGELAASAGAQQPSPGVTAEYAYRMADAMLQEREK